jgi:DNA polymerase III subunit epsilon
MGKSGSDKMKKIFWFDVETTGLDPVKNDIIQLACAIEVDGVIVDKSQWFCQPKDYSAIDESALQVNGLTTEELKLFPMPFEVYADLISFLEKHCDKYNKEDKMCLGGFNVQFDIDFLRNFFKKNNDEFFGSWFNHKVIDPMNMLRYLDFYGIFNLNPENYKLSTICKMMGIPINAHDAMSDIEATIMLNNMIVNNLKR